MPHHRTVDAVHDGHGVEVGQRDKQAPTEPTHRDRGRAPPRGAEGLQDRPNGEGDAGQATARVRHREARGVVPRRGVGVLGEARVLEVGLPAVAEDPPKRDPAGRASPVEQHRATHEDHTIPARADHDGFVGGGLGGTPQKEKEDQGEAPHSASKDAPVENRKV